MRTPDATMTWRGVLPSMLEDAFGDQQLQPQHQAEITRRFEKMADAADRWNALARGISRDILPDFGKAFD